MRRSRRRAAAGSIRSRSTRCARHFSATATASSIRPRSAGSTTRRRSSSITRATIPFLASLSHEVAQISRSISRVLGLEEDLAEALALAHDLGHTPFGHAGEEALNAEMVPYGGVSHHNPNLRRPH